MDREWEMVNETELSEDAVFGSCLHKIQDVSSRVAMAASLARNGMGCQETERPSGQQVASGMLKSRRMTRVEVEERQ